jgi:hypothetical protein
MARSCWTSPPFHASTSPCRALQELAALAGERSATIVLRAVNADVYRVLKQLKLAERFSFLNC